MNGRGIRAKRDTGRDGGRFIAIPVTVLECAAYIALSHPAKALLLEFALQCKGDDNGRLLLSRQELAKRGWKSTDVLHRAKNELMEAGFLHQTVMGQRPNKASWFAITWRRLDRIEGFDPGAAALFEQGAYRKTAAPASKPNTNAKSTMTKPEPHAWDDLAALTAHLHKIGTPVFKPNGLGAPKVQHRLAKPAAAVH